VDDSQAAVPIAEPAPAILSSPEPIMPRWQAALQVTMVCGVPTQIAVWILLVAVAHMPMGTPGNLSLEFIATLSLLDTALIAVLIRVFLSLSREASADVFVGVRPVRGEILRGLALLPIVYLGVTGAVFGLRTIVPQLHNVETSPFEAFMNTPLEAGIFLVVVVLAGGVREELQRAFILHRFEQRLGGVKVGLVLFTIAFGAFHLDQGIDVAVAICLLGLFWGIVYIRRRSAIVPMVNHASFNAAQVLQVVLVKSLGA